MKEGGKEDFLGRPGVSLHLLHSSNKALLDLRNHSSTRRCPLELSLTLSTAWAMTKKYMILLSPLPSKLLFHHLPFLSLTLRFSTE